MRVDDKYLNLAALKERKWTPGAIERFLGEPDGLRRNPMYRNASPMKLYLEERVLAVEKSNEYQEWFNKTKSGRQSSSYKHKDIAESKREEMLKFVNELPVHIDHYSSESELFAAAVDNYHALWLDRDRHDKEASVYSCKTFLKRIAVNMLRHNCDSYEPVLDKMYGKVGVTLGYTTLKERVIKAIYEKYPYLTDNSVQRKQEFNADVVAENAC